MPQHLKLWTDADPATGTRGNYGGERYDGYYVAGFKHRDSDLMTENNFDATWARLEPLNAPIDLGECGPDNDGDSVLTISTGHWAVGWTETILVHSTNAAALRQADEIAEALENYPSLDDDSLSEREQEAADQIWRDCYNDADRVAYVRKYRDQFEFRDFADMIGCLRGRYFAGYASELVYR